jgi:hypothetical protein
MQHYGAANRRHHGPERKTTNSNFRGTAGATAEGRVSSARLLLLLLRRRESALTGRTNAQLLRPDLSRSAEGLSLSRDAWTAVSSVLPKNPMPRMIVPRSRAAAAARTGQF